jgi:serine O-acetyltransferase
MNDPMVQAIHRLIDHAATTDAQLQTLVARLRQSGLDCGDDKAAGEGFDPQRLNQMID